MGILLRPLLGLALVAASCASPEPDVAVVPPDESAAIANEASYANATGDTMRNSPDGLAIEMHIEYFEGIRFGEWTAPEECAYNARVRMGLANYAVEAATRPFDGPTASSDRGEGWVGGLVRLDGWAYLNDELDAMVPDGMEEGTDEYAHELPGDTADIEPLIAGVVAVFGHEQVASLRLADRSVSYTARGRELATVDTQPLDGWAVLAVLVPASLVDGGGMPGLELEFVDRDGGVTSEPVSLVASVETTNERADEGIYAGTHELEVMTDDWIFDPDRVGEQCVPPVVGDNPDNELAAPDADIFQNPIANPPPLPEPGESPEDPTQATADALAAIRATYDLSTPFDDEKARYSEDPEISREIFRAVREDNLLAPYMSNLDPVFGSLVFTSPTTASVVYRVGPSYQWEVGRVLLIDGAWRTAIGTICRDLAAAVYSCPTTVAIDPPPGPLG